MLYYYHLMFTENGIPSLEPFNPTDSTLSYIFNMNIINMNLIWTKL